MTSSRHSNCLFLPPPAGVILLKAETRERIAILGVKSNRYLCMDLEGRPFSSVSRFFKTFKLNDSHHRSNRPFKEDNWKTGGFTHCFEPLYIHFTHD